MQRRCRHSPAVNEADVALRGLFDRSMGSRLPQPGGYEILLLDCSAAEQQPGAFVLGIPANLLFQPDGRYLIAFCEEDAGEHARRSKEHPLHGTHFWSPTN